MNSFKSISFHEGFVGGWLFYFLTPPPGEVEVGERGAKTTMGYVSMTYIRLSETG